MSRCQSRLTNNHTGQDLKSSTPDKGASVRFPSCGMNELFNALHGVEDLFLQLHTRNDLHGLVENTKMIPANVRLMDMSSHFVFLTSTLMGQQMKRRVELYTKA